MLFKLVFTTRVEEVSVPHGFDVLFEVHETSKKFLAVKMGVPMFFRRTSSNTTSVTLPELDDGFVTVIVYCTVLAATVAGDTHGTGVVGLVPIGDAGID